MSYRGCEVGIEVEISSDFLMRSTTTLVMKEKAGGDLVHPIGSQVDMATSVGSPGRIGNGVAILSALNGVMWNW